MDFPGLADRLASVRDRIGYHQARGGWTHPVRIVAVTKSHGPEAVRAALAYGLEDIGENRVQAGAAPRRAAGAARGDRRAAPARAPGPDDAGGAERRREGAARRLRLPSGAPRPAADGRLPASRAVHGNVGRLSGGGGGRGDDGPAGNPAVRRTLTMTDDAFHLTAHDVRAQEFSRVNVVRG